MSTLATALPTRRAWRNLLRIKLALVDRRRYQRTVLERIDNMNFAVLPDVFNPVLLRSGEFLVRQLFREDLLPRGSRVLDLGCGSGAAGIAAAKLGCHVTAVDINPSAVRCTRANALLNDVNLEVHQGDLFGRVDNERFDVVLFNPPYFRGTPRDALDHAWRSADIPERFAARLAEHLNPGGFAMLVLSSDGEPSGFLDAMEGHRLEVNVIAQRDFVNEVMTVYRVTPA